MLVSLRWLAGLSGCAGLVFVLLNLSAGMYPGSLTSGIWISLTSGFPRQRIVIIFDAQNCDLGNLVPAFWLPVGSLWYFGAPWEIVGAARRRRRGLELKFDRFGDDLGNPFWEFFDFP